MDLLLQMNVVAAVLIAAIVVIRALALYQFPKKIFLVFWGIAALRLLIPVRIPLPFDLFPSRSLTPSGTAINTSEMIYTGGTAPQAPGTVEQPVTTQFPFAAVWLAGICIAAIFFLASYLRFRREANASLPCENAFAARWLAEHPLRRAVRIRQTDRISAPLTYGVLRPVILLPKTTGWQSEEALRCILTHEYVHIRRFDTLTKLAFAATACVHWFNPLVWVMYILANRDIELSCDEAATNELGAGQRSVYLHALIALEETKTRMAFPLANHFGKHSTKERMSVIMKKGKYTTPAVVIAVALALCIGTAAVAAMSDNNNAILFDALSDEEVAAITAFLDEQGEEYTLWSGDTILVPEENEARLKAELLMEGYPAADSYYHEFDFNALTEEGQRQAAFWMALQDLLAEVISHYDGVEEATVIIGETPGGELSASVAVMMSGGKELTDEVGEAICSLVTDAVRGMKKENVAVMTSDGIVYESELVSAEITTRTPNENTEGEAGSSDYSGCTIIDGDSSYVLGEETLGSKAYSGYTVVDADPDDVAGEESDTNLFGSVQYSDGKLTLSIQQSGWIIHIAGRVEVDWLGGMSVHYLEGVDWESGKDYSFDVSGGGYTELGITATYGAEEVEIDLMRYLPDDLKAASALNE